MSGSVATFESLFKEHHRTLCELAYNIVNDKDAAKDIVQDVFFKLWKNRNEVEFKDQIKHYLFRATSHTALNYLRFNKKIFRIADTTLLENSLVASPGTESIGYKELELRVRHAIEKLPARCKAIYVLSRHEGLKYQEIAETLNLSLKTVENQMGLALQRLRDELKPYLSPEFVLLVFLIGLSIALLFF